MTGMENFLDRQCERLRGLVNGSYTVAQCAADQKAFAKFGNVPLAAIMSRLI